jgi:hypothetical protein
MIVPLTLFAICGAAGATGCGCELQPASRPSANKAGKTRVRMGNLRKAAGGSARNRSL